MKGEKPRRGPYPQMVEKIGGLTMTTSTKTRKSTAAKLSASERAYLSAGLKQPGGKLPLFDNRGQEIEPSLIKACIKKGLAERWFANPLKPEWLVCRLTETGRSLLS